jgi:signal transduction histidine kinase
MVGDAYLSGRILVVDDEESNVLLLERMLTRAGYRSVTTTTDSREALPLFRERRPDLVLLDLMMPHLDGFAVMEQIQAELPDDAYVPILVLTADVTPEALRRALSAGARDFLTKPFDHTELLLRVKNLLETRLLYLGLQHQMGRLEQMVAQAERAIRVRDESLSEITHDIGQPLAALKLTAELLRQSVNEGGIQEPQLLAQDLARLESAADQISAMISELSDLARLQIGRDLVLQRQPTDLVSLAGSVLADMGKTAHRHKLRLETAVDSLVGNWDPVRIRRVLTNLVDNAIKYSPVGGDVVIALENVAADGGDCARLTVRDRGIGIPAGDLPHVFDRFFRAGNAAAASAGTGVGLAGVKQIVEQHGGSISLESVEGEGTTVTVTLPLESRS